MGFLDLRKVSNSSELNSFFLIVCIEAPEREKKREKRKRKHKKIKKKGDKKKERKKERKEEKKKKKRKKEANKEKTDKKEKTGATGRFLLAPKSEEKYGAPREASSSPSHPSPPLLVLQSLPL